MIELLEVVTEEQALEGRTDITAPFIRQFFAKAGTNVVRAFRDHNKNSGGYVFVHTGEDTGEYCMFVTVQVNPTPEDAERFKRQFTNCEWFTGAVAEIVGQVSSTGVEG